MVSWRALCFLVLLSGGSACSCMSGFIPENQGWTSEANKLLQQPLVFTGHVLSVSPADNLPEDESTFCALPQQPVAKWGSPCQNGQFDRWQKCGRRHFAEVRVLDGIKGIAAGETFKYNCTIASCGDCSPPCPKVGEEILDGTKPGGAQGFCSMRRCALNGWNPDPCQQLLHEVRQDRSARGNKVSIPVPVAFSTIQTNPSLRSQLLNSFVEDVLDAVSNANPESELTESDVLLADLGEDNLRTVRVEPFALLPSSIFEITLYMQDQSDLNAAETQLREVAAEPFTWTRAMDSIRGFCLKEPCPLCQTTCVDPSQTSLVSPGVPLTQ